MSLSELLVIIFVALILLKPEDFPKIIEKLKDVNNFLTKTKKELSSYLNLGSNDTEVIYEEKDSVDQINFYLEKITSLGEDYEGEYSLEKIRDYYRKLVKKSMLKAMSESNSDDHIQSR